MRQICVITGGGSGMGLATARIMGKSHYVIICGRSIQKLEKAIAKLKTENIECEAYSCDVSNQQIVRALAIYAKKLGNVQAVIHAAGMSPHMDNALKIMQANALGTIYINEEFSQVMESGSCIVDISSMSAYLTPKLIMPQGAYKFSLTDKTHFMKKMMRS